MKAGPKTTKAFSRPPDVVAALAADAEAKRRFDALPPSHQREYLKWIDEAKKPETRRRRLAQLAAAIRRHSPG
jgi:uncharacterized protein YdeI (YjbR/CyaY-like superfamily)